MSERTNHTPGPWRIENIYGASNSFGRWHHVSADPTEGPNEPRQGIADIIGFNHDDIANARLIAAAPDLLDALTRVRELLVMAPDDCDDAPELLAIREIDAAIRKAEGGER